MTSDEQAIRDLISTWLSASAAGDTATVLKLMSVDVVFIRQGQPPMRGRDAFAASQTALKDFQLDAKSDIRELQVSGDFAYCWSYLTVVATPLKGGTPMKRAGDVLSIFRKQPDGAWTLHRDANLLSAVTA
jgi:uncharacterized protein (TIGR02246 family)